MTGKQPEVWLRGPVSGIPPQLQPIAHGLLQTREELRSWLDGFPEPLLWSRPAGVASVGFHLQHMAGVIDRLFTYARSEPLSEAQRQALQAEGSPPPGGVTLHELIEHFDRTVDAALEQLRSTEEATLTEHREVGRGRLPSTVIGLLFHACEHSQRHLGQLLVTSRVIRQGEKG
jgi:uncharacterized damage-inducible protein DinB